jgi:hypothetical protein
MSPHLDPAATPDPNATPDPDATPSARPPAAPGRRMIWASWAGTLLFVAVAVPLAVTERGQLLAVAVDLSLFAGGCAVFLWALALAAGRSREREIGMGGLFFLAGTAPPPVRLRLLGSLAVEVLAAFGTAAARPFTALAFGILVPTWGLALCGLWAARHGTFGPRQPRPDRSGHSA